MYIDETQAGFTGGRPVPDGTNVHTTIAASPTVYVRGGVVAVPIGELISSAEIAADWRALSVVPFAQRGSRTRQARMTVRVSSLVTEDGYALYPIGASAVYRRRLRGKLYTLVDERVRLPSIPLAYAGTLAPYQDSAVEAMSRVSTGLVVAPCGSGKGEMIVALLGRLGLTTLVMVGTIEQAVELRERIAKRLKCAVGMIGDGAGSIERVTIALIQAMTETVVDQVAELFEVVVRDEAHHAAADGERSVYRRLRARRWYGFTATIEREDGLRPFVHHHFGPMVAEVSRAELVAAGRSVTPEIHQLRTEFLAPYSGPSDWRPLLVSLASDRGRNELIVRAVMDEPQSELCAVITGSIDHAECIASALRSRGRRAEALSSRRSKKDRAWIVRAAREGDLDVIVGTNVLDEAIDLESLSRVFLVWPAKAEGKIVQRIGRALRPSPGKEAIVYDFVDERVGVLRHQARQRRAIYDRTWPSTRGAT